MTPTQVQYRVTRLVGEGAFGSVYEGERVGEGLSRRVAMKVLQASHTGRSIIESRLRDEARMLSLIRHRAIVRVDDLIRIDDAWCVVMEYVEGADLRRVLEKGPVPPRAALQVAEEVASALHAAYGQAGPEGNPLRLVHRDIKPENIRLTPQGEVKLLDFGIARAEFRAREAATQHAGMGTVIYMSAERFRGEDTHAGDVYALGVTLFELLTGVPPGSSAADADRYPPGRVLRPQWDWLAGLDTALVPLLTRMMDPEPEQRPTGRECARALAELRLRVPGELLEDWAERALAGEASPTTAPPPAAGRLGRAASTLAPQPGASVLKVGQTIGSTVHQPFDLPQRRGRLAVAALVVLLGSAAVATVVATGGYWGWRQLSDRSSTQQPESAAAATSPPAPAASAEEAAPAAAAPAGRSVSPAAGSRASQAAAGTTSSPRAATPIAEPPAARPAAPEPAPATAPVPAAPTAEPASPEEQSTPAATAAPAAPPRGRVVVTGAEVVRLEGVGAPTGPGMVAPGKYAAVITFAGGTEITVRGVRVEAGKTTTIRCDESFATCLVSGGK